MGRYKADVQQMMRRELPKGELTMIIGSRAVERRSGSQQLHFRYEIGIALISSPCAVNYRERVCVSGIGKDLSTTSSRGS